MKYIFWTISLLIIIGWIYLLITNINTITSITLLDNGLANALHTFPRRLTINMALLILILYFAGECAMFFFLLPILKQNKEKESAYERKLEKTSVSKDESSSKVKVLEAKIEVLEKALEDALKKRS